MSKPCRRSFKRFFSEFSGSHSLSEDCASQGEAAERQGVAERKVRHPVAGSGGIVPPRFSAFVPIPERQ